MALRLGDPAPNFTAETTEGQIDFYDWKGDSWAILFSHPADFTPVCTTELGYLASIKPEFDKRNTKILAVSVDSVEDHNNWVGDIAETQGTPVNYPIIADQDRAVAEAYDMIHPGEGDTSTVRSVFVIGPDNAIKLQLTYPKSTGRNFDEILRVIDSLQVTAKSGLATPAQWQQGREGHRPADGLHRGRPGEVPRRRRAEALPALRRRARLPREQPPTTTQPTGPGSAGQPRRTGTGFPCHSPGIRCQNEDRPPRVSFSGASVASGLRIGSAGRRRGRGGPRCATPPRARRPGGCRLGPRHRGPPRP